MRKLTENEIRKFNCLNCSKQFQLSYRITLKHSPKFCSLKCKGEFKTKSNANSYKKCDKCGENKPKSEFGQVKEKATFYYTCKKCRDGNSRNIHKHYMEKYGVSYTVYIKGLSPENFLKDLLKVARVRAREKNRDCLLTIDDLLYLYNKQNGLCAISRVKMTHDVYKKKVGTNMSLDRIDSNKGYTIDNVQIVCYTVNIMKNNMSLDELKEWCARILNENN